MTDKSQGHIEFAGQFEFFQRADGGVYRAKVSDPIMTDGCRFGRWECSRPHFDRFRDVIVGPLS